MLESLLLATALQWQMPHIDFTQEKLIEQPVKQERRINSKGVKLVKQFEGLYLRPYFCQSGKRTVGWGHTGKAARQGRSITVAEAEKLLDQDMREFEAVVNKYVKVPLTDNQFSALVSFAFNTGEGAFQRSTLLKKLNKGDYVGAANELLKWRKGSSGILRGLVLRRKAELELFNTQEQTGNL